MLQRGENDALVDAARQSPGRVLRVIIGRLYSDDRAEKERALSALGALAGAPGVLTDEKAKDLLRRFLWALNDESGAVPYGAPEAIGEILAVRSEFRETYGPILYGMLTEEEMLQTGPVERGILWALARIGPDVSARCPEVVAVLHDMAENHPDHETREQAKIAAYRVR